MLKILWKIIAIITIIILSCINPFLWIFIILLSLFFKLIHTYQKKYIAINIWILIFIILFFFYWIIYKKESYPILSIDIFFHFIILNLILIISKKRTINKKYIFIEFPLLFVMIFIWLILFPNLTCFCYFDYSRFSLEIFEKLISIIAIIIFITNFFLTTNRKQKIYWSITLILWFILLYFL